MDKISQYDVFLSHTSADKKAVENIAQRLRQKAKLQPFLDKWHLIPGEPWQEKLEEALDQSRTCAVFLGPSGLGSWENEEMRDALDQRVRNKSFRVIPVLLPGADPKNNTTLPRFLRRLTWVDFRQGLEDTEAFHRLNCGIKGIPPEAPKRGGSQDSHKSISSIWNVPSQQNSMERNEHNIFISYAKENLEQAKALAEALETQGWSIWWDRTIQAGKLFDEIIEEAISTAKCVIVIWSKDSVKSRWVRSEANEGANRNILVPILIDDTQIPLSFRLFQAINLVDWDVSEKSIAFRKLVTDIEKIPEMPPMITRKGKSQQAQTKITSKIISEKKNNKSEFEFQGEPFTSTDLKTVFEFRKAQTLRTMLLNNCGGFPFMLIKPKLIISMLRRFFYKPLAPP